MNRRVKLPPPVAAIYRAVTELEGLYPGRKFTPDGHLVGSIGEVVAAEALGLTLHPASHPGHDAFDTDGDVQIKMTGGDSVSLYATCDRMVCSGSYRPKRLRSYTTAQDGGAVQHQRLASDVLAFELGPAHAGPHPLDDEVALQLRDRSDDHHDGAAQRPAGVDLLAEADELHVQPVELVEHLQEVLHRPEEQRHGQLAHLCQDLLCFRTGRGYHEFIQSLHDQYRGPASRLWRVGCAEELICDAY